MNRLLRLTVLLLAAVSVAEDSKPLAFTAEQINPVVYGLQRDHYCTPYKVLGDRSLSVEYIGDAPDRTKTRLTDDARLLVRPSGEPGVTAKLGLTEMWASESRLCDLNHQKSTFYDSVWRDAVRFETIINYKAYFGAALAGKIDLADYAVDDGIVKKQMMDVLTTDTTNTFGAQNDDILWWALAFLRAYEYDPSHEAYLKAAQAVFARIRHTPEQSVCGGGITWGAGTHYKNAITNALYLRLATRLAGMSPLHSKERKIYLAAAIAEAGWLLHRSGLWVAGGVLADGIHFKGSICDKTPESSIWTYSQGVAISGLAQLTLLTGDREYADRAQSLLLRVLDTSQIPRLVNGDRILEESSTLRRTANEDAQTFKGIFVENVGYAIPYFREADPERYASAVVAGRSFLIANANALWSRRRMQGTSIEFPFDWTDAEADAADPVNMRTTTAAIDLFNAAWSVREQ